MPNKTYALEWPEHAKRNLETAILLLKENHYSDIIALEIHQAIEKTFKTILACHGEKMLKSHNLVELKQHIEKYINPEIITLDDLLEITDYYDSERYPGPKYFMPSKEELR
ncbi:MAG: HEPN domain-containing protein [Bacteroidales bacterium]|nr:HEPN domain-containing protein [Bacteroidales bacterium]